MEDYILQTNNLTKKYGNHTVVDHVNIHIKKNEIYGFVGRNGAGKTTIIRMLCGLIKIDEGSISLFSSKNATELIESRKKIGAIVESPSIYLNLNSYDNLYAQGILVNNTNSSRIKEILELVGLPSDEKDSKKAKNYSLGMKQRLGIAMTLLSNPKFLILDEPINGLDPNGIVDIRNLLIKLNQEYGVTIMISTHILGELSKLATRYGFLEKGKLVKELTAVELEKECRHCLILELSKIDESLLSDIKEYEIKNDFLYIYSHFDINSFIIKLNNNNIKVLSIHEKNEDLEQYFISTIGGHHYD